VGLFQLWISPLGRRVAVLIVVCQYSCCTLTTTREDYQPLFVLSQLVLHKLCILFLYSGIICWVGSMALCFRGADVKHKQVSHICLWFVKGVFLPFVGYLTIKKEFYCVIACISLAILGYVSQKPTRHARIYSPFWATIDDWRVWPLLLMRRWTINQSGVDVLRAGCPSWRQPLDLRLQIPILTFWLLA